MSEKSIITMNPTPSHEISELLEAKKLIIDSYLSKAEGWFWTRESANASISGGRSWRQFRTMPRRLLITVKSKARGIGHSILTRPGRR